MCFSFCCEDACAACNQTYDFASLPTGFTTHELAGSANAPLFSVSGGRLRNGLVNASNASWYQCYNIPQITFPKMSVEANLFSQGVGTYQGVFLGPRVMYYHTAGQAYRINCDSDGDTTGSATLISIATSTEPMKIVATRTAATTWTFQYYVDSALQETETGVSWDPGSTFNAGVWCESAAEWDNLAISCPTAACPSCASAPLDWTITVSGIVNRNCLTCSDWNGTFTLGYQSAAGSSPYGAVANCNWYANQPVGCGGTVNGNINGARWYLSTSGTNWELRALAGPSNNVSMAAVYRLAAGSFSCLGSNVLTRVLNSMHCLGWPDTITVSPA